MAQTKLPALHPEESVQGDWVSEEKPLAPDTNRTPVLEFDSLPRTCQVYVYITVLQVTTGIQREQATEMNDRTKNVYKWHTITRLG